MEQSIDKIESRFTREEKWILVATISASSMAFIDSSALNVALASIQSSLQASGAQLLWVINGYLLMLAALILVGGSLGDKLGRKKVFISGISIFLLASVMCGLSPAIQWMIAARILQGIGGAFMIPGSLSVITSSISPNRIGKAFGIWSAVTSSISIGGPILGGTLADIGFWRGVFFLNLPVGLVALYTLSTKVPESRDETSSGHIDFLGALIITLSLAGLTYGFISAPDLGFRNPLVYLTLAIGILGIISFVIVEARKSNPMLPLHLFKSRTFAGTNLLTLFLYGGLSVSGFFLSLNLIQVQGYSKTQAGLVFIPLNLILIFLSRWTGGLVDRIGPRLPLILGPALAGLGFLWMAFSGVTNGPIDYWKAFFPGIALLGIGMGFTVAPLTTSVMGSVETRYSGVASGINNAVSRTAGVLAIAIIGSLALFVFTSYLQQRTHSLDLGADANQALLAEATKLGGAAVPPEVGANNLPLVAKAIKEAFADTYRIVLLTCAGMAWISAILSAALVQPKLNRQITG